MPPRLRLPRPALLLRSRALLAYSLPALAFAQTSPAPATPPDAPVATAPARDTASPVTAPEGPVRIAGANGREVDFAGIWEAMPEGLVVVVSPEAPLSLVTWDKFDLTRLKTEHPSLDAARQRALFLRSPQPVNLGLFAGLLTPAQAGSELRRLLGESLTVKVPLRYRTTTTTSSSTTIVPPRPVIYNGIILPPVPGSQPFISQNNKTVSETRFSPDELTTSARRVLEVLSRTDGIVAQDRRDLFDLVKANPVLLTQTADGLDRIAASLPPRHLLPNEPTFITLALRLREFSTGLRELTTSSYIDYSDQMFIRDLLYLADSPQLR
jgi:hypothetical protein